MIKIGNTASNISVHSCRPQNKKELKKIIEDRVKSEGPNCDLNDIDTSLITDMSYLFYGLNFNGDISNWNVSSVKNMDAMFAHLKFTGDISRWDVSNVEDMRWMFEHSVFNKDISNWKINEDCYTNFMFDNCPIKEEYKPKSLQ